MLRILIADDERHIRKGLEDLLNAQAGFSVVKAAANGEEALEAVRREEPDVVLTDIRMPRMDGRELVRELQRAYPRVRKVIISGYEDFSYAHETMRNGAIDYLLKPIDEEELVGLLRRIEAEMQAEARRRSEERDLQDKLGQGLPLLREEFVRSLLRGTGLADGEIAARLEYLGLELAGGRYCAVFVSPGASAQDTGGMRRAAEDALRGRFSALFCEGGEGLGCVLACGGSSKAPAEAAQALFEAISTEAAVSFAVCLGDPSDRLSCISESYAHARQAAKRRFYTEGPALVRYEEPAAVENRETAPSVPDGFTEKFFASFTNAAELERTDVLHALLNEAGAFMRENGVPPDEALKFFSDLFSLQQAQNHEFRAASAELRGADFLYFKEIERLDTLGDVLRYTMRAYAETVERMKARRSCKDRKRVEVVRAYIERNYRRSITLAVISDLVFVNPNYFCEMFRSQTGESFVDYLTRVRIEKAKAMLRSMSVKVYEVGAMVGYEDSGYFCKVFKRLVGVTPGEYRNLKL
jgi:two-component system response regulator YesN